MLQFQTATLPFPFSACDLFVTITITYPFCPIVTVTSKSELLPQGSLPYSISAYLLSCGLAFFHIQLPMLTIAPAFLCVWVGGLLYKCDGSAVVVLVFK